MNNSLSQATPSYNPPEPDLADKLREWIENASHEAKSFASICKWKLAKGMLTRDDVDEVNTALDKMFDEIKEYRG